jgi:hypothetical protein
MTVFRKRPVEIEARELTPDSLYEIEAWCGGQVKGIKLSRNYRVIDIYTLEGEMRATMGDWVIKGIKGEFYPCKPDIFAATYEAV